MAYKKPKSFRIYIYTKHGGEAFLPPLGVYVSLWQTGPFHWLAIRSAPEPPVATPSVPLQCKAFGATIRKGPGFLQDPRKQLRSPRCLRLVSGHRELSTSVPGRKSCLGLVPGFRVCT